MRTVLRAGLLLLLASSPLPFGAVQPWAILAIELAACAVGLLALTLLATRRAELPARAAWIGIAAGCVVAIGIVQLLPFRTTPVFASVEAAVGGATARPLSLSPADTVDALVRFTAYALVALAAAVAIATPRELRQLATVVAASGVFQAVYGSAEYLSGHQHIFGYAKRYYFEEASGTFINCNHFAGYLAMTLPFALGLLVDEWRRLPRRQAATSRLLLLSEPAGVRLIAAAAAVALIFLGVILSYSRGGLIVALLGAAAFAWMSGMRRRRLGTLAALIVLPALFVSWMQVRAPGERFLSGDVASLGGRLPVWRATLRMVADHPWLGSGWGTFEEAFPQYYPADIASHWEHAHSDWLQVLAEGGCLGAVAVGAGLLLAIRRDSSSFPLQKQKDSLNAAVRASLIGIGLYSLADFSLRIPAIALLTAAAGLARIGGPAASSQSVWRRTDGMPPAS